MFILDYKGQPDSRLIHPVHLAVANDPQKLKTYNKTTTNEVWNYRGNGEFDSPRYSIRWIMSMD